MPIRRTLFFLFLFSAQLVAAQQPLTLNNSTKRLKTLLESKSAGDSVQLVIAVKNADLFQKENKTFINAAYFPAQTFVISLTKTEAARLLSDPNVLFADLQRVPKEELTTGSMDNTVNKINYMHHHFPQYKGDGIYASVKEQQFDSTDIDFRGRYFNSRVAAATGSSHASIMATMLGGGGNSTLSATGAAPAVLLTGSTFATLLPDADAVYRQFGISVQNHSYGTGIENYYGADAMAYDKSVLNNPTLVHVFSSGNKGTSTPAEGTYAGIEGMANLTGSFKMAKNIITVGAVDSFSNVVPLSSKGPAYDGRVKPEIVAYGLDGSSGAAALVSGTAAVLQQAFRSIENRLPSAALLKAVLINSADDRGTPQVDYSYGFGNLNAYKALNTILQQRYWQDSLAKREKRRFVISIPQGIAQLKVTLTWTEAAAAPNATKALVNDLHASLMLNGESWQPWILNHTADKAALMQPAMRGKDTLNNVEQITIENPEAGEYELLIDGTDIQTEKQTFSIAYQLDTVQTFAFTFPTSSDALTTGSTPIIKWQTDISDDAVLEYATIGGNWQSIQSISNIQKGWETFSVPEEMSKLVLRMRLPSQNLTFISDTIVVAPEMNMDVGFNCADSFMLYWNNAKANGYQLYSLGEKYMEPIDVVTDTFAVFNKTAQPNMYFAVTPRINGQTGNRSQTINYTMQGTGCYLYTFFAFKEGSNVRLDLRLGTLYGVQKIEYQVLNSQKGFETFLTDEAPAGTALQAIHNAPKRGVNLYRAAITTSSGAVVYSGIETIYHFTSEPVIVYPNPARQNEPVRILAEDLDVYSIEVIDAGGKKVFTKLLEDYSQQIPPLRLPKGVYFIRTWLTDKTFQTQKLIVY